MTTIPRTHSYYLNPLFHNRPNTHSHIYIRKHDHTQTPGIKTTGSCLRKSAHEDLCSFDGGTIFPELFVSFSFVRTNQ